MNESNPRSTSQNLFIMEEITAAIRYDTIRYDTGMDRWWMDGDRVVVFGLDANEDGWMDVRIY